jgi:phage recombination protein Bet
MGSELEVRPGGALAVGAEQTTWTEQQLAVLRSAGVSEEVTPAELDAFLHECQRTKLDPFSKQIYLIGRYDNQLKRKAFRSQTGIDGYRVVAHRVAREDKAELEYEDTLWCGPDGVWRDVWLAERPPAAAKVVVYKGGKRYSAVATLAEYAARYPDGNPMPMWKRMPANQLEKCAEVKALRRAFPNDLGGIYTAEEMEQADARDQAPVVLSPDQAAEAVERKARRERHADPAGEFAVRPAEPTDAEEIKPEDEGLPSDEIAAQAREELLGRLRQRIAMLYAERINPTGDRLARIRWVTTRVGHNIDSTNDLTESEARHVIRQLEEVRPPAVPLRVPGQAPGPQPRFAEEPSQAAGELYEAYLAATGPRDMLTVDQGVLHAARNDLISVAEVDALRRMRQWKGPQLVTGPAPGQSWSHQPAAGMPGLPEPEQGEQLRADISAAIEAASDIETLKQLWTQAQSARAAGMLDEQQFAMLDELGRAAEEELGALVGAG